MTQTNNEREAFELAVINNLGKEALLKENLSPLEIFERGWNAREQSSISQNEQQEPIALLALKNTELNRRIEVLEDLLASAAVISLRKGEDTHWDRFIAQLKIKGICFVTPKTFKILPSDEEYASPPKQAIPEDSRRLNWIEDEAVSIDTFGMNDSFGWIFTQYYLNEKEPREIYRSFTEDLRKSIDQAMLNASPTNTEVGG